MRGIVKGLLLTLLASTSLDAKIYKAQTFTLANGLQVIVVENHRAPVVTQMVWYRVGSADDPVGKSGLAHFLEHMMFKGPVGSASEKITQEVEARGGTINAATSFEYTFYYQTVAAPYLEDIIKLESDRMKALTVLEDDAQTELQVILEERRMRTDNSPFGHFMECFHAQFFRHDPKRLPPIGWAHEIKGLTPSDVHAFHQKWYAPSNALLVIAGDVTFKAAQRLVQKYYGPLKPRPVPKRHRLQEPPLPVGTLTLNIERPDVQVPYLIKAYPAPTIFDREGLYSVSSDLLKSLLGDTPTGFLHKELVEKKKVATFVTVHYPRKTLGKSYFLIACQPTPETSLNDLERHLAQALDSFRAQALTEESLQKATTRLLATLVYRQDSVLSGRDLAERLTLGQPLEALETWDEQIRAVSLTQVEDLFDTIFQSTYHVTGTLLPSSEHKAHLEEGNTKEDTRGDRKGNTKRNSTGHKRESTKGNSKAEHTP